jgi:hypothetical protein
LQNKKIGSAEQRSREQTTLHVADNATRTTFSGQTTSVGFLIICDDERMIASTLIKGDANDLAPNYHTQSAMSRRHGLAV